MPDNKESTTHFKTRNIGPYLIVGHDNPGKVWISCGSREGGEFSRPDLVAAMVAGELAGDIVGAVDRFFWENF